MVFGQAMYRHVIYNKILPKTEVKNLRYVNIIKDIICYGTVTELVRGSLKTWHMYIVVASPPSLAPLLDIFV